jgi:hypothetical protein
MRTRNGKIARLPHEVREELNQRLERAQPSPKLLEWLNALPEVQEVLREDFEGEPVSRQNLSQWRQGGYLEWSARRDLCDDVRGFVQCADEMDVETDGELADAAAIVVAGRLGSLMANWDGEVDAEFEAKSRVLNRFCRSVVHLQRGMRQANEEHMKWQRITEEKEKAEKKELQKKLIGRWYGALREPMLGKLFGGGTVGRKIAKYVMAVRRGDVEADLDLESDDTYGDGGHFGEPAEPRKPTVKKQTAKKTRKVRPNNADKLVEENEMDVEKQPETSPEKAKPVKVCHTDPEPPNNEETGAEIRVNPCPSVVKIPQPPPCATELVRHSLGEGRSVK